MKMRFLIPLFLVASAHFSTAPAQDRAPHPLAGRVVVVYNAEDSDAGGLARHYMKARGIPEANLIRVSCPIADDISRGDYNIRIRDPIKRALMERGLYRFKAEAGEAMGGEIRYLVLIRGLPLRIADVVLDETGRRNPVLDKMALMPAYPEGFLRNGASLDSELALLPKEDYALKGPWQNPYFDSIFPFAESAPLGIFLVTRLDAITPREVRGMIDDAIQAEDAGLKGFAYVDMRGIQEGAFAPGDRWLQGAVHKLEIAGWTVRTDNKESIFDPAFPMTNAALYMGWYAPNVTGPFTVSGFRFNKGAIAYHLHSFSATTLRDPNAGWAGPLIRAGAAATMGAVSEPYLDPTPHLDIFTDRLLKGFNLADSAYASLLFLSWQITVIGDPLYTPLRKK